MVYSYVPMETKLLYIYDVDNQILIVILVIIPLSSGACQIFLCLQKKTFIKPYFPSAGSMQLLFSSPTTVLKRGRSACSTWPSPTFHFVRMRWSLDGLQDQTVCVLGSFKKDTFSLFVIAKNKHVSNKLFLIFVCTRTLLTFYVI